MAKKGWPKGKLRGPMSEARKNALRVSGKRATDAKRHREVEMAAKASIIDITPAAWLSPRYVIGDCEYVENGCDEQLLHALKQGIVYADRLGYHEPAFQEITIDVLAAVEKQYRKKGPLLPKRRDRPVIETRKIPRPVFETRKITLAVEARADAYEKEFRAVGKARAAAQPLEREGKPLTAVVAEMFPGEGKPLLEVVSDLFDS